MLRNDYSAEAWLGPPDGVLGWWQSTMPPHDARRARWAPNDVMINLLAELEPQTDRHDLRYVLSLLLLRRRVVRLEDTEHDEMGREVSVLYCPRNEATYRVLTVVPSVERAQALQQELAQLLEARAAD